MKRVVVALVAIALLGGSVALFSANFSKPTSGPESAQCIKILKTVQSPSATGKSEDSVNSFFDNYQVIFNNQSCFPDSKILTLKAYLLSFEDFCLHPISSDDTRMTPKVWKVFCNRYQAISKYAKAK